MRVEREYSMDETKFLMAVAREMDARGWDNETVAAKVFECTGITVGFVHLFNAVTRVKAGRNTGKPTDPLEQLAVAATFWMTEPDFRENRLNRLREHEAALLAEVNDVRSQITKLED